MVSIASLGACHILVPGMLNIFYVYSIHGTHTFTHTQTETGQRHLNRTAEEVYFPRLCIVNNVEEECNC